MRRALDMFVVEGIQTTIPLHEQILNSDDFRAGKFDTSFVARLNQTLEEDASSTGAG
jgi:acetyl-CoA carboxylase biotin carboxylase subunit